MGRVSNVGGGYGTIPKGYYMRLDADGACSLYSVSQPRRNRGSNARPPSDVLLASGKVTNMDASGWQNVKLQFLGPVITGFVNGQPVLTGTDSANASGMAGLITGGDSNARNTAMFDNLIINKVNGPKVEPTIFEQDGSPIYKPR
jgi:galactosylceramidase